MTTKTTTTATETTEAMTLAAAQEALTDAGQVVMDAYDVGTLFEALLDDLCQHRLTYEESPDDIDKAYLHIGEVCEHLMRLTQIMRTHWVAEKALRERQWAKEAQERATQTSASVGQ